MVPKSAIYFGYVEDMSSTSGRTEYFLLGQNTTVSSNQAIRIYATASAGHVSADEGIAFFAVSASDGSRNTSLTRTSLQEAQAYFGTCTSIKFQLSQIISNLNIFQIIKRFTNL
jgi:hypothetical protein